MAAIRKYDWEGWFGRPRTVLLYGVHYDTSQSTMVQVIRNNASRRGLKVRVQDNGGFIVIEVISDSTLRAKKGKGRAVPHTDSTTVHI